MKHATIVLFCLLLSGCGYFFAGTWSDDPKNWKRAFDQPTPPEGVEVVHSWYTRTPHFTAEYTWFFELKLSEKVRKELLTGRDMIPLSALSRDALYQKISGDRPEWFKPDPLSAFEVFESEDQRDFVFFIEKNGSRSFWTRRQ